MREANAKVAPAGPLSQLKYGRSRNITVTSGHYGARNGPAISPTRPDIVAAVQLRGSDNEAAADALYDRLAAQTAQLVNQHWSAIERVAQALLRGASVALGAKRTWTDKPDRLVAILYRMAEDAWHAPSLRSVGF